MRPTISANRSGMRWVIILLASLLAIAFLWLQPPAAASAEETDDGQEITDFYFAGVITFDAVSYTHLTLPTTPYV